MAWVEVTRKDSTVRVEYRYINDLQSPCQVPIHRRDVLHEDPLTLRVRLRVPIGVQTSRIT